LRNLVFLCSVLLLTAPPALASGDPPCALDPATPSVTICSPADGATVASPVDVVAWAKSNNPVSLFQVYVDGAKVWEEPSNEVDIPIQMSAGTHRLTVQAKDSSGATFKKTINITVGSSSGGGACTLKASDPSVTICAPVDGATVASPVHVVAGTTSSSPVSYMQVYVDGAKRYEVRANKLDTQLDMTAGAHRVTVQAKNNAGTTFKETVNITVGGSGGGSCTASIVDPSVTICSPVNGSSVASPVHLVAETNSSSAVRYMQVYVDGVKTYQEEVDRLDIDLNMAVGSRRVTVQAKNNAGVLFKQTVNINVAEGSGGTEPPPASGVTVTPRTATIAPSATQQFAASATVAWSVDGIGGGNTTVGTIAPSGLYTAPSTTGTHIIGAVSTSDSTKTGSATVHVTRYTGTFTHHNDNHRTGQNLNETVLTPGNVNKTQFGKLFSRSVDGYVFAQPLYAANVDIPNKGTFNVIYVATEHNSVYAFDADGKVTSPLWKKSLIDPANGVTPMSSSDVGTANTGPEVGITGTPVIDPATHTLYLVAATKENGKFFQRLHALDIRSGAQKTGSPATITAKVPGKGDGNDGNGNVVFNPVRQNQRPALLLSDGVVYIGWGSHHTIEPWHGWLIGYDAATLQQVSIFNSTPDNRRAGIWQGGGGPAAEADGDIFLATGQGTFTAYKGGRDYGDTLVKLAGGTLTVMDYFTPFNQAEMNSYDLDMGSGGPLLLPDQVSTAHPRLVISVNKQGNIYLVDRDNMGKHRTGDDQQIVQVVYDAVGPLRGTPAYWNGFIYFAGAQDVLKAYKLSSGLLSGSPVSKASQVLESRGAVPVVSASGTSNGLVWIVNRRPSNPAVLYAYDARDLTRMLYNTEQSATRDSLGRGTKFSVPTVANGRVYVGTTTQLVVYGLLP
jgi:hypothetical protein